MHIISGEDRPQHVSHLKAALLDIQKLSPDSIGIFTVGDNTDRGKEENYICLRETVDSVMDENSPPIYYALGNHDLVYGGGSYEEQVALFKQYTGMPSAYYSVDLAGTKFIVLGSESLVGEGTIGEKQLDWLRQELAAAGKNQPVFLFLHQPLIDTVSGSLYSQDPETQTWYGIDTGDILRAILKEYPNAVLFTGHTHWTLESSGSPSCLAAALTPALSTPRQWGICGTTITTAPRGRKAILSRCMTITFCSGDGSLSMGSGARRRSSSFPS